MLKIFDGFGREQASDVSGLSHSELRILVQHKVVQPIKTRTGHKYSFSDLLMLKLISNLKKQGVKIKNVTRANYYLKELDPNKKLTNFKLYIRDDTKSILYLGEKPDPKFVVSLDQFGQMMAAGLLTILPVGKELEAARQSVISMDRELSRSMSAKKVVSLEALEKKYGLG